MNFIWDEKYTGTWFLVPEKSKDDGFCLGEIEQIGEYFDTNDRTFYSLGEAKKYMERKIFENGGDINSF
jgi:hypothetical protein